VCRDDSSGRKAVDEPEQGVHIPHLAGVGTVQVQEDEVRRSRYGCQVRGRLSVDDDHLPHLDQGGEVSSRDVVGGPVRIDSGDPLDRHAAGGPARQERKGIADITSDAYDLTASRRVPDTEQQAAHDGRQRRTGYLEAVVDGPCDRPEPVPGDG
jgi:hypothetical protein